MELGTRIKLWREHCGLSQRAFAAKLRRSPEEEHLSAAAVSLWESNKTTPTQDNLEMAVAVLGLTMARFYGDIPKPRSPKSPAKSKRAAA